MESIVMGFKKGALKHKNGIFSRLAKNFLDSEDGTFVEADEKYGRNRPKDVT